MCFQSVVFTIKDSIELFVFCITYSSFTYLSYEGFFSLWFSVLESPGIVGRPCNRYGSYIVLTLITWLAVLDQGNNLEFQTGPAVKVFSWQQHNKCYFVSFVMSISGAKFEEHCFNNFRDILYLVLDHFSCNLMTSSLLTCITQKRQYL